MFSYTVIYSPNRASLIL